MNPLHGILADTWWYGLTRRCTPEMFEDLAKLRAAQGFNAIQLVVGIPPETGPLNQNNWSDAGPAWDLDGNINQQYLKAAAEKVQLLNNHGHTVIVYGGWGYQIDWIGHQQMTRWWQALIKTLDHLDVVYCLCGELDLWTEHPDRLLPDKTTDDQLDTPAAKNWLAKKYDWYLGRHRRLQHRVQQWREVAISIRQKTKHLLIVHPTVNHTGKNLLGDLVDLDTFITGHDPTTKNLLWEKPVDSNNAGHSCMNLEPWYEGIQESFGPEEQLFAYWCSILSGTLGFCYGAQGIWNMGDGSFLNHWGKQDFSTAKALNTPALLGASHQVLMGHLKPAPETAAVSQLVNAEQRLGHISRSDLRHEIIFYPNGSKASDLNPNDKIWLPLEGKFATEPASQNPVVVIKRRRQSPE